eukprot:14665790-Heterocapsa_arctica.AAC.1
MLTELGEGQEEEATAPVWSSRANATAPASAAGAICGGYLPGGVRCGFRGGGRSITALDA